MTWNKFFITLITGLAFISAASSLKDGFEKAAEKAADSNSRHWGGYGHGGHHHQNRPDVAGMTEFCEQTRAWLDSTAANVTATNGTVPSMQELLVDFLTALCPDTRSDVRNAAELKTPERHGWGGGWGWGVGHPMKPNRNPLKAFCARTETWLQTVELNVTADNETDSAMQEAFVDFLSVICDLETRGALPVPQEIKEIDTEGQRKSRWFHHPKPQRALEIFCERTNEWLSATGSNVSAINGTGDNFPTVFIDFLTNICEDNRRTGVPATNDVRADHRWFHWGHPPPSPSGPSNDFGLFCDEANSWLNTTTVNITSSGSGTSLTAAELFVDFLGTICEEEEN